MSMRVINVGISQDALRELRQLDDDFNFEKGGRAKKNKSPVCKSVLV